MDFLQMLAHLLGVGQQQPQKPQLQMGQPNNQFIQGPNNFTPIAAPDIQGRTNPGEIPLQNSGQGGPGYVANLQPTVNPQQNSRNVVPWK